MTARKKVEPSLLKAKKATVCIERNGLSIRVDDVEADKAGLVAADLLAAMRLLAKTFPEVIQELQPVAGYNPLSTVEDDWAEEGRRRTGFTA